MPTPAQITKIHVLKNELKLTDDEYRAALSKFRATSSTELDVYQAISLIEALVEEQMRREGVARGPLEPASGMATLAQRGLISHLFETAGGTIQYPCSWMSRIVRHPVENGDYELTTKEASMVIDALKRHNRNIGR